MQMKLDFWIQNGLNVLFIGHPGVGKTAIVREAFDRNKLKWQYFSASTMDPWVDFIGVPKETKKEYNGVEIPILELVRPELFATGEIEALFFDEFNRSPKKVRNAVMELLQFKSINGKKFPKLKMIWAAINPDDEDIYDVEKLDPAQQDRFEIIQNIPYKPNAAWFRERFGRQLADAAIGWWNELEDDIKKLVSPRRLEYVLKVYEMKGDIRDVFLRKETGVAKLIQALKVGPVTDRLMELIKNNDTEASRSFLSNENNFASAMKYIPESSTLIEYFIPLISKEKMASLMAADKRISKHIIGNCDKIPVFHDVCDSIMKANTDRKLVQEIRKTFQSNQELAKNFAIAGKNDNKEVYFNESADPKTWAIRLLEIKASNLSTPINKMDGYHEILKHIPKTMTANEALDCLELLNIIVAQIPAGILNSQPMGKLPDVINHCLKEFNRNTNLRWIEILSKHGNRFKELLNRLQAAGLEGKIYQP